MTTAPTALSPAALFSIGGFLQKITNPDTLIGVTDFVGEAAGLAIKIGPPALWVAQFAAGFIPGLAPAVQVLSLATPVLQKIAMAAPIIHQGLEASKPIDAAIRASGPDVLAAIKQVYALALNADPAVAGDNHTEVTVSETDAVAWAAKSFFERSFFLPQDPRFARQTESLG